MTKVFPLFLIIILFSACDNPKEINLNEPDSGTELSIRGSGDFTFTAYEPLKDKPVQVYYHIPEKANSASPVLMVFTGAGRDAKESRDAMVSKADQLKFIVVVPEFSNDFYPGGDQYNLGNIFEDGDHPDPSELNPETEWTFSIVDPLFQFFKERSGSGAEIYDVFGHSAGAQFSHRLLMFKPQANYGRVVSVAAGWYTMPDKEVEFPYGLLESPIATANLAYVFAVEQTVMVGTADNDPNAASLRHNAQADAQGDDRLERAQYYYNQSRQLAQNKGYTFNWQYKIMANVGHDFEATSAIAANILYN